MSQPISDVNSNFRRQALVFLPDFQEAEVRMENNQDIVVV
jgi:hypothetical protein